MSSGDDAAARELLCALFDADVGKIEKEADRTGAAYFRGHSGRSRASQSGALVRGSAIEPKAKEDEG